MEMKCPNCGAENPDDKRFCGECGKRLDMSSGSTLRTCVGCGRAISFDAMICQYCGYDYRPQATGPAVGRKMARRHMTADERESGFSWASLLLSFALIAVAVWAILEAYNLSATYGHFDRTDWMWIDAIIGVYLLVVAVAALILSLVFRK